MPYLSPSDKHLDVMQARADAVPEGPWDWNYELGYPLALVRLLNTGGPIAPREIIMAPKRLSIRGDTVLGFGGDVADPLDPNIPEFIAQARLDIPQLLAEIRRLRDKEK